MKGKQKRQRTYNQKDSLKEKGITLIALVVTIIILLILAGVAIASVTVDNGLFRKAREATNMYKDAERDEQGVLRDAENELSKLLNPSGNGGGSGGEAGYVTGNTKVDVSDGSYYIPDGFKLAEDSGKTINEGIVVEDKNRNQWVWIPCYVEGGVGASDAVTTGLNKYDRYIFGNQIFDPEDSSKIKPSSSSSYYYTESLDPNDQASIRQFGGYYIGRYEAGDKESTLAKEMRTEAKYSNSNAGDATHTVTIKKGQAPYNYVTQAQCVTLSEEFDSKNGYNTSKMYTKLCSSYAWDTALKFIGGDYATNSTQGNYYDTTFTYTDISGAPNQPKNSSSSKLVPTGQTTAVKKIYDMGGNLWEYTSESSSSEYDSFVDRGGYYGDLASDTPAGGRVSSAGGAHDGDAFRSTLYLRNAES